MTHTSSLSSSRMSSKPRGAVRRNNQGEFDGTPSKEQLREVCCYVLPACFAELLTGHSLDMPDLWTAASPTAILQKFAASFILQAISLILAAAVYMCDAEILGAAKENVAMRAVAEYMDQLLPSDDVDQRRRVRRFCGGEEFSRQDREAYPFDVRALQLVGHSNHPLCSAQLCNQ